MMYRSLGVAIGALVVPACLLLFGFLYQWIGRRRDRRRMLAPGTLLDIGGGHTLYLLEKGFGGPTVIFESGFAASCLNFRRIQAEVAEQTHTVAYDRCGLGWSSAATSPRTPANIAAELHSLLLAAGVKPPFVLVGHSFGGLVMRRFALDYAEDVAGVVLIDPMRTEEWPPANPLRQRELERAKQLAHHAIHFARFGVARRVAKSLLCGTGKVSHWLARRAGRGGTHLLDRLTREVNKLPEEIRPAIASHWSDPAFYQGFIAYLEAVPATVEEMHEAPPIANIPVVVLTPQSATPLSEDALSRIAVHSRQIIARHSRHWIHLDEPQLVIDTIVAMTASSRSPAVRESMDVAS